MDTLGALQGAVFEHLILPLMLLLGLDAQIEEGYVGSLWLLAGVAQLLVIVLVLLPLQRWRPVEIMQGPQARADIRSDVVYTLIHRLGLFRAVLFISLEPVWSAALGLLRTWGLPSWHLDGLWPGVSDQAWLSFILYLLLFDFLGWLLHWLQHRWVWWWQLHAVHHSQRHMTAWSDNRNHLLDDVIHDAIFVFVGLVLGMAPAQFVAVVAVMQLMENLAHANLRLSFGPLERVFVSPRFHRLHHAVEPPQVPQAPAGGPVVLGCNYGVLLSVWDGMFGTANFDACDHPTGLRDQRPEHGGRDYGTGFWAQQRLGLLRLMGRA